MQIVCLLSLAACALVVGYLSYETGYWRGWDAGYAKGVEHAESALVAKEKP